jgi:hypothetical protein
LRDELLIAVNPSTARLCAQNALATLQKEIGTRFFMLQIQNPDVRTTFVEAIDKCRSFLFSKRLFQND